MSDGSNNQDHRTTRRSFIAGTSALAGTATMGMPVGAQQTRRNPKRGGTVRFGTRDDSVALDTHRNFIYFVSQPLAATTGGLLDFNSRMEPVPAVAAEWDVSADLLVWTFKLRKGAEFHNGQTIDAEAVKWNIERIMDPKIGHSFNRSALTDVERVTVDDKFTVQIHLKSANAAFDTNVIYYPVNLMAPGAVDNFDTNPVGCGPFKFKSWKRFDTTELVRFENFWETDAEGNSLPYLDALIGKPKKEDRVRLTALRAGELDLIDNMAYADSANFVKEHGSRFDTYVVPQAPALSPSISRAARSPPATIPMPCCCAPQWRMPSTRAASMRRCSTISARWRTASTASTAHGARSMPSPARNTTRTRRKPCARKPKAATRNC